MKTPITLCIMDGFGLDTMSPSNAISPQSAPNIFKFLNECPNSTLIASGLDVGLTDGQMGNSEVGHTNIGAGRVVYQDLPRISNAIKDGSFFNNEAYLKAVDNCKKNNSALHIMGLMSDGGVHSHNTHTWALIELAKRHNLNKVYVHCFLDGRDVPPSSAYDFVKECEAKCEEIGVGRVATVMGRYYVMDRDKRWDRVELAYNALVLGEGAKNVSASAAIRASYDEGITDEFVKPVVCVENAVISDNDSVIFSNFRPDRAREITRAIVDPSFDGFERKTCPKNLCYVCTTMYDATIPNVEVAFKPESLNRTLGQYISDLGMRQLRIAETEKYAHVTFFFNGGIEKVYPGEDRVLIPSPKVATYDLQPEMSAYEVTEAVIGKINSCEYDLIILNFANCDMVGHTGVFPAARKAVETVDECVARVVDAMNAVGGITLITADHGNAEKMVDTDGVTPFTAHTTNLVPFIICGADVKLKSGRLADIAPTILDLMGLNKPDEMDGNSLII